MTSFTDTSNRRWNLSLSIGTAKKVRDQTGVNLLAIVDQPQILIGLAEDPVKFVDVLFVLVSDQADALSVSDIAFGESIDGEVLEAATLAFLESLTKFFTGPRREMLLGVLAKTNEHRKKQEKLLSDALASGAIDKAIEDALNGGDSTSHLSPPLATNPST